MKTVLLYLYTESALHAGTGSGLSAIDLPIQRERTTGYPNIQGSGVKGALRNESGENGADIDELRAVFGPDTGNASDYAGALSVGEARIVLFPVRSLIGIFAYVTCTHVLARLAREVQYAGLPALPLPQSAPQTGTCFVNTPSSVTDQKQAIFEEFSFSAKSLQEVDDISQWLVRFAIPSGPEYLYWQDKIMKSLVILSDDDFKDFVLTSTEVATHVKLNSQTKTVAGTGLWTTESLPSDTLMVSAVTARRLRLPVRDDQGNVKIDIPQNLRKGTADEVADWVTNPNHVPTRVQIGGDETTGQGFVSLRWQTM